jgi:hypothetical protein
MNRIEELQKNIKKLSIDYLMERLFADKNFRNLIVYLNKEEQLFQQGIDGNGNELTPEYAPFTISEKQRKGQRFDHVTLKDTGSFYKSFVVSLTAGNEFLIEADTIKEGTDLRDKYGVDILGLSEESLDKLIDEAKRIIIPIIQKEILGNVA